MPIPDDDHVAAELPPAGEDIALTRWREFLADGVAATSGPATAGPARDLPDVGAPQVRRRAPAHVARRPPGRSGEGVDSCAPSWRGASSTPTSWAPPRLRPRPLRPPLRRPALGVRPVADAHFAAWAGRAGLPIVDAGMRQLLSMAWMHNRVRMIVASFLVKDLHLPWQRGARHFMQHLADGDLASNQHGWQWVAGTGTDAAPFFRVFNPITQGEKFDPDGEYVRRFVPECVMCRRGGAPAVGAARRPAQRLPAAHRRPRGGAPGGPRALRAGAGVSGLSAASTFSCGVVVAAARRRQTAVRCSDRRA